MAYLVCVDDNYQYQDESERYGKGRYETADDALAAARKIVDGHLESACKKGMQADLLLSSCRLFR